MCSTHFRVNLRALETDFIVKVGYFSMGTVNCFLSVNKSLVN